MDCRDLRETDRVRTYILNVADSKVTSAKLSLGEGRMDGSSKQQRVEYEGNSSPGR